MASSFVEEAILKVVDQSSPQLRRINAEIQKLLATAQQLKSMKIDFGSGGLAKAQADIRRLDAEMQRLKSVAGNIPLRVNPSGIAQATQQISQLRAHAARPLTLGRIATGLAAAGVGHALAREARAGITEVDIGQSSLNLKQLSTDRRAFVDAQISDLQRLQAMRPGGALYNLGQISQQMSEMLGVVKIGAAESEADFRQRAYQARIMADQNLELARTLTTLGKSSDAAIDDAIKFGKAIDIQGAIYDKVSGKLDPAKVTEQYNLVRSLIPVIGKEMTGSNFLQLIKYMRASRFGLSPEGIALAMSQFEEQGTSAAVGLNQFIKNLSGRATPAALEEQRKLGLIDTKLVTKGRVGRQTVKEVAGDMAEEPARKLREFPQRYVNEDLVPALKRELMQRKGMSEAAAEAELNNAAYVSARLGKLFTDRTAHEMAVSMVLLRKENEQFLKDWRTRFQPGPTQATADAQRRATEFSITAAVAGLQNQLAGVFGEAVRGLAPAVLPALGAMTETFRSLADDMNKAARGDTAAQKRVEHTTAKALEAGAFAMLAKGPMAQFMAGIAAPLGTTAGLAAAIAPGTNEATRSLALAGVSLNTAALGLQAAGAAQLAAFGAGSLIGTLLPGLARALPAAALGYPFLSGAGGAPARAQKEMEAAKTPAEREAVYELSRQRYAAIAAARELAQAETALAAARAKQQETPTSYAKTAAEVAEKRVADLQAALAQARDAVTKLEAQIPSIVEAGRKAVPGGPDFPAFWKWLQGAQKSTPSPLLKDAEDIARGEAARAIREAGKQQPRPLPAILSGIAGKPVPVVVEKYPGAPLPRPRPPEAPRKLPAILGGPQGVPLPVVKPPDKKVEVEPPKPAADKLVEASGTLSTAVVQLANAATTLSDAAPPFAAAVSDLAARSTAFTDAAAAMVKASESNSTLVTALEQGSSTFAATFSTGAQQIGAAGETAASIIAAQAPGAGAAYGEAAAAVIMGAVANLHIDASVDVKSKPDSGRQTSD